MNGNEVTSQNKSYNSRISTFYLLLCEVIGSYSYLLYFLQRPSLVVLRSASLWSYVHDPRFDVNDIALMNTLFISRSLLRRRRTRRTGRKE